MGSGFFAVPRSDHCPAMKGIETQFMGLCPIKGIIRSDHCPAMKGIETILHCGRPTIHGIRSDHCPAMKGIETTVLLVHLGFVAF